MENLPHLKWIESRGAFIPNIEPPKNWESGVEDFYKNKGKEKLEKQIRNFSDSLDSVFGGKPEIQLRWDKEKGLDGISLSAQQGIYLNKEKNWQEHNLGTRASLLAFGIISNYYAELSKYIK